MAWTTIPDSDIDPDSPITTALMTALRDNVAAAFAGDVGAPQLHPSSAIDDTITTTGSQSLGAGATWTPSQGFYNMSTSVFKAAYFDIYVSAAWRSGLENLSGSTIFDGTNVRIRNDGSGTASTYWQRFDG